MNDRFDAKLVEERLIKKWLDEKTYAFDKTSVKKVFSVDTPPPTVSGNLHIGHIYSYIHADLFARYKRLAGENVYYPMGFDDNGLPTEKYVEKELKIRSKDLKRSEFIAKCLEKCVEVEDRFKELWQKIGLSVDWTYCYTTISPLARRVSQKSFLDLYKKGLILRKKEPSLFCTDFKTTVSQADLEFVSKDAYFSTLLFAVENEEPLKIATTRPELLSACVSVFVNPSDERYKNLIGKKAKVPLYNHWVPILGDEDVLIDKGTGAVLCATFGDHQDTVWFKRHNLPLFEAIDHHGKIKSEIAFVGGLKIKEARESIIKKLEDENLLIEKKLISHDVAIYERSKREIEYIVLNQWFINILDHKEEFLKRGEELNWTPHYMKSRYDDWVKNLSWNWCISRQRYFGIPFPVWHCQDCNEVLLCDEKYLPIDPQEQPYPGGSCPKCSGKNIAPDTDVMDTWATSASTPQINAAMLELEPSEFLPMSIRPQAHDIIRTWAFDTIVKSTYQQNKLPWTNILISGHVQTSDKQKISKSLNNNPLEPNTLIASNSADAIRYWASKGKLGIDTAFSQEQIKNGGRLVTKLWNALKFCKEHIQSAPGSVSEFDELSIWVLNEFNSCLDNYHKAFEKFDASLALEAVEHFFWHTFCDNYLELVKDSFFNPEKYSAKARAAAPFVLKMIGLELLKLYAPFIPFVTEEIFLTLFSGEGNSIHNASFGSKIDAGKNSFDFSIVVNILGQVRKLKSEHALSLKTEINDLILSVEAPLTLTDPLSVELPIHLSSKELVIDLKKHVIAMLENDDAKTTLLGSTKSLNVSIAPENFAQSELVKFQDALMIKIKVE